MQWFTLRTNRLWLYQIHPVFTGINMSSMLPVKAGTMNLELVPVFNEKILPHTGGRTIPGKQQGQHKPSPAGIQKHPISIVC